MFHKISHHCDLISHFFPSRLLLVSGPDPRGAEAPARRGLEAPLAHKRLSILDRPLKPRALLGLVHPGKAHRALYETGDVPVDVGVPVARGAHPVDAQGLGVPRPEVPPAPLVPDRGLHPGRKVCLFHGHKRCPKVGARVRLKGKGDVLVAAGLARLAAAPPLLPAPLFFTPRIQTETISDPRGSHVGEAHPGNEVLLK